ncbi:2-oxoglutarate dehydrogenase, E2 component, dihydrolipoamide succinyltransferase [Brevibacterium daeguense]|uniref:Dihydrolipoamide acetyltransferase component of pyruvate dehydrogenase complex n=1 Tax=Brevibacterium daeguense TaxID=909936 RepID=A0ABP8ENU8_9MICO|nr:2-oxoglutarate dehydrogenase, E2 component, dihydrolipoamide succinyltransferase [Brevibacterium daeguense]
MSNTVQMPALGESVTEGTVTRWLKEVGDEVAVDEPLLEVSTDKVDTEIPSPYAGVLEKILAEEDDEVEVGGDLAVIGDGSGSDSSDDSSGSAEGEQQEAPAEEPEQDSDASDEAPAEAEDDQAGSEGDQGGSEDDQAEQEQASDQGGSAGGGESIEVTMPALGESVTEGTVTRWLKEVGDEIEVDEPLLEVSTDKVDTEVPSPVAGIVQKLLAEEDDTVEVGEPLALIGSGAPAEDAEEQPAPAAEEASAEEPSDQGAAPSADAAATEEEVEGESDVEDEKVSAAEESDTEGRAAAERVGADTQKSPEPAPAQQEQAAQQKDEQPSDRSADISAAVGSDHAAYVTPLVRKLAKSKGVDLGKVTGSGVGGRIRKQDVLAAAQNAAATQAAGPAEGEASHEAFKLEIPEEARKLRGTTQKAPRIRQTIATRMHESLQTTAQLTQVIEIDMSRVVKLRKARKQAFQDKHGVKLTYLPFFAKAITEALQVHPKVNAVYDVEAKEITYFDHEHLGIAVDTDRGLLVPVIKDAGELSIAGLSKAIDDLAERTRTNKIGPDELSGGTFTITNIGSVGALFDTPILNVPQVGIIGTGIITRRPKVVQTVDGEESIAIRDLVYLPLTYNHQLVDGADAGRFLQSIKARLEDGNFEADLDL